jgi:hypothetical protein
MNQITYRKHSDSVSINPFSQLPSMTDDEARKVATGLAAVIATTMAGATPLPSVSNSNSDGQGDVEDSSIGEITADVNSLIGELGELEGALDNRRARRNERRRLRRRDFQNKTLSVIRQAVKRNPLGIASRLISHARRKQHNRLIHAEPGKNITEESDREQMSSSTRSSNTSDSESTSSITPHAAVPADVPAIDSQSANLDMHADQNLAQTPSEVITGNSQQDEDAQNEGAPDWLSSNPLMRDVLRWGKKNIYDPGVKMVKKYTPKSLHSTIDAIDNAVVGGVKKAIKWDKYNDDGSKKKPNSSNNKQQNKQQYTTSNTGKQYNTHTQGHGGNDQFNMAYYDKQVATQMQQLVAQVERLNALINDLYGGLDYLFGDAGRSVGYYLTRTIVLAYDEMISKSQWNKHATAIARAINASFAALLNGKGSKEAVNTAVQKYKSLGGTDVQGFMKALDQVCDSMTKHMTTAIEVLKGWLSTATRSIGEIDKEAAEPCVAQVQKSPSPQPIVNLIPYVTRCYVDVAKKYQKPSNTNANTGTNTTTSGQQQQQHQQHQQHQPSDTNTTAHHNSQSDSGKKDDVQHVQSATNTAGGTPSLIILPSGLAVPGGTQDGILKLMALGESIEKVRQIMRLRRTSPLIIGEMEDDMAEAEGYGFLPLLAPAAKFLIGMAGRKLLTQALTNAGQHLIKSVTARAPGKTSEGKGFLNSILRSNPSLSNSRDAFRNFQKLSSVAKQQLLNRAKVLGSKHGRDVMSALRNKNPITSQFKMGPFNVLARTSVKPITSSKVQAPRFSTDLLRNIARFGVNSILEASGDVQVDNVVEGAVDDMVGENDTLSNDIDPISAYKDAILAAGDAYATAFGEAAASYYDGNEGDFTSLKESLHDLGEVMYDMVMGDIRIPYHIARELLRSAG